MKKTIFILFIFYTIAYAKEFTIASYNVENFFDLIKQNTEYKEYIPNKSKWNTKTFNTKLNHIVKVIKDMDFDIIALQEIENQNLLKTLIKKLPSYKYYSFTKYKRSAVGLGFLSKIKIKDNRQINVKFSNKVFRPILETTFILGDIEFKVFNNHWPSKRSSESYRIKYAKALQDRLKLLPFDYDYILLGDFNSNYDEMTTFRNNKRLNNTQGITGINQVLNTSVGKNFITYDDISKEKRKVHYNLWLDVNISQRFSNKYKNQNNTPDNIILPSSLFDTKKISYIKNSFGVFKAKYLFKNKRIFRWKMSKYTNSDFGYSDHLPIYARFSTSKTMSKKTLNTKEKYSNNIEYLYKKEKLINPIILKNIRVIYKFRNSAIIKDDTKAIYMYNNAKDLKLGYKYDIKVNQILTYNGLKEVKDFSILKKKSYDKNYKKLFLDANNIDILNPTYQNEIIKNLKGIVKNKKLYFSKDKYINLYTKNKKYLPQTNSKILFKTAHLSIYKGNVQILIHSKKDYKVIK